MWIIKHWHELKEKYGSEFPMEEAAKHFAETYGKTRFEKILERAARIFGR